MFLQRVIENFITMPSAQTVLKRVLILRHFDTCPGGLQHHHTEAGGLKKHTEEVVEYGILLADKYKGNTNVIIASAIFHDVAKIKEYLTEGSDYRQQIGHVAGSFLRWAKESRGLYPPFRNAVGHCILAHHGRYEWGSPKIPQTIEAIILHAADMKSAQNVSAVGIVERWLTDREDGYV